MDPNACLIRILEAMWDDDREEVICGLEDLAEWLDKGGFMPTVVREDKPVEMVPDTASSRGWYGVFGRNMG